MDFEFLQTQLLARIRARVRNGEITERSLARVTGVSQPHLHNVLKGVRLLSMDMADQIMHRLRIDLLELALHGEDTIPPRRAPENGAYRQVQLMEGCIGPGHPYPEKMGYGGYPFLAPDVEGLRVPVAVWLAPDPRRPWDLSGVGVVLLDCAEGPRGDPCEDTLCALDLKGSGAIARVRRRGADWFLWDDEYRTWQRIPSAGSNPLDLIKGCLRLVIRHF